MSKKSLDLTEIQDELQGASLFFTKSAATPPLQALPTASSNQEIETVQPQINPFLAPDAGLKTKKENSSQSQTTVQTNLHEGDNVRKHARMHANIQGNSSTKLLNDKPDDSIETIRKTVKQVGKVLLYLRVTSEEKQQLSSIVYAFNEMYRGEGRKTSENEVSRIGLNWLVDEYQINGENSVLAKVVAALNA